jgi:hypothetical protein
MDDKEKDLGRMFLSVLVDYLVNRGTVLDMLGYDSHVLGYDPHNHSVN